MKKIVVGFHGLEGHGKTFLANYLRQKYNFEKYSFAYLIKETSTQLLRNLGINENVHKLNEKDKNKIIDGYGFSCRDVFKEIGMSIRSLNPDTWVKLVKKQIEYSDKQYFTIDDVRFENEVKLLQDKFNVKLVKVVNLARYETDIFKQKHITNKNLPNNMIDFTIKHRNNGVPENFDVYIEDLIVKNSKM